MMGALHHWIKNLILVVLFASFIQLLVPSEPFKRYIRVVMGFFIIITLLHPLLAFLQLDPGGEIPWPHSVTSSWEEIQRQGEDIRNRGEEDLVTAIKREREDRLEEQLRDQGFPLFEVLLLMEGQGHERVFVTLALPRNLQEKEKIQEQLFGFFREWYHLPASQVHLEWKEG